MKSLKIPKYQRSYQNPYIDEGQTAQWQKETGQNNKQRPTSHTHKTKDRVTRIPLKIRLN
jgi:hypothetical protein